MLNPKNKEKHVRVI